MARHSIQVLFMMPQIPSSRFVVNYTQAHTFINMHTYMYVYKMLMHLHNVLTHQARCNVELMSPEADYTEHYDTGEYGSQGVGETDDEGVN